MGKLLKWAEVRSWGVQRRAELDRWLAPIPSYRWTGRCARSGGGCRLRPSVSRGRLRPVNDTWVAACRPAAELPLVTYNRADFEDPTGFGCCPTIGNLDEDTRQMIRFGTRCRSTSRSLSAQLPLR